MLTAACGDTPVADAEPEVLATLAFSGSFGPGADGTQLQLLFGITPDRDYPDSLIELIVSQSDSGGVRLIDAETGGPTFAVQGRRFTDGVDAFAVRRGFLVPGGGGTGISSLESAWIAGGLSGEHVPDFAGYEIAGFEVHLDRLRISGGNWNFQVRINVLGRSIP